MTRNNIPKADVMILFLSDIFRLSNEVDTNLLVFTLVQITSESLHLSLFGYHVELVSVEIVLRLQSPTSVKQAQLR